METQKLKIAIVILNWNGEKWLKKFLPTIISYSNEAEIFLGDNASTDKSVEFVSNKFPEVNIILNKKNYGYSKGYNTFLKQINAEYFVLINSDIEVTKGWLSPIIKLMDSDQNIAACQPKILDYKNKRKFEYAGGSGGFIDRLGYPFCRGRIFEHLEDDTEQYNDSREIFWASGACLFVRSSPFFNINGLDEDFFAHQEEIDLCWRLKNNNYKVMVEPKSKVYHVGGGTLNTNSSFKTYLNFRNNLFMLFKNLTANSLIIILTVRLILDGIAAFNFLKQKNGFKHFFAIGRAHFSFYLNIPKLILKRRKINQNNKLTGIMNYSIVLKNKVKGVKKFADL